MKANRRKHTVVGSTRRIPLVQGKVVRRDAARAVSVEGNRERDPLKDVIHEQRITGIVNVQPVRDTRLRVSSPEIAVLNLGMRAEVKPNMRATGFNATDPRNPAANAIVDKDSYGILIRLKGVVHAQIFKPIPEDGARRPPRSRLRRWARASLGAPVGHIEARRDGDVGTRCAGMSEGGHSVALSHRDVLLLATPVRRGSAGSVTISRIAICRADIRVDPTHENFVVGRVRGSSS